jgi:hypothetical protein
MLQSPRNNRTTLLPLALALAQPQPNLIVHTPLVGLLLIYLVWLSSALNVIIIIIEWCEILFTPTPGI